jgi:hypothetical protein
MLDSSDKDLKANALRMWANWIETSDPLLSAADTRQMGDKYRRNILEMDQMKLVIRLRELADKEEKT